MIIVLLIISILIFCYILFVVEDDNLALIPYVGFVIKLGVLVYLLIKLIEMRVINEKIELYTNQNNEIENKIAVVVKQYMEHENKTFKDLKTDTSYITLTTLYPELKSDKLIEKEIDLYEANNEKIITLKEQKINERVYKWWLYFGGK